MFEILEHTADIGFRATARTLPELFASAAEALVSIAMETGHIEPRQSYPLTAVGDSSETLFVNWLNEVLYCVDGRRLALHSFEVEELTAESIRGAAHGEPRDPERHAAKLIVKGVTYHQLRVGQASNGWYCEVYLDI